MRSTLIGISIEEKLLCSREMIHPFFEPKKEIGGRCVEVSNKEEIREIVRSKRHSRGAFDMLVMKKPGRFRTVSIDGWLIHPDAL